MNKKIFFLAALISILTVGVLAPADDFTLVCSNDAYTVYLAQLSGQLVANLYQTKTGSPWTKLATLNCQASDNGRVSRWNCQSAPDLNSPGYVISILSGGAPVGPTGTNAQLLSQGNVLAAQLPCYEKPAPVPAGL